MSDVFFEDLVTDFYSEIGSNFRNKFERGQIFRTPIGYITEDIQFWRPSSFDEETKTIARDFHITFSTADAFKKSFVLFDPQLESNEEFLVTRAKKRPAILLTPKPTPPAFLNVRGGAKIHKSICLLAPLHSIYDLSGNLKFPENFINDVRKLKYLQFFFFPSYGAIKESILRLDSIQPIFEPHLEPLNLKLSEEVLEILKGQIELYISTGEKIEYYANDEESRKVYGKLKYEYIQTRDMLLDQK